MIRKILAIFMVVMMIVVSVTGCASTPSTGNEEPPKTGGEAPAGNEQPAEERALRLRITASLPSLDWEQTTNTRDMKVWHQMYEGLYGMDEANNGYYKELAKEVALSEDKLVYTITLQDGVKFQNGESLKSSDVVFSYNRAMKNSRFNYLTSMIKNVEVVDDSTVKFTLDKPYSPIDHTFFCIKILSEKEVGEQGDKFGTIPHKAGTGPYYVTEYNVATGVKLSAFEEYWRGIPNIKNIEYIVISDESAAVIAYENNELDYFEDAPLSDWDSISKVAGENKTLIKGNNIMFMAINYLSATNNKVLANDKVRQAIFYAVNKNDINLAVSNGYGTEAIHYMPPEYVATSPKDGFETYDYNVEKAKQLLTEAGFPNGVDVGTIMTYGASTSNNAKMAQVLQANFAEVGITAQVSVMEAAVVTPKLYAQDYDICIFADSGNYDFNNIRQQVHSESVGMYVVKYKDGPFNWQRIEELVDLGASTSSVDERVAYYKELWSIIMDSATILPGLHRPVAIVWADDLDIGKPVPTYYKVRTFSWK
jgi:peptide/nickel transport system substrate-binding protein